MRGFIHIIFILFTFSVMGQEWRDNLSAARDAYKNEKYTDAFKYYEAAQKTAPKTINLSAEMAQTAYKANEFEKAEEIYERNSSKNNTSIQKANSQHNIGNARMKKKDYPGAVDAYKESLRNNPADDQTRYNLSEAIRQLKKQEEEQEKQQQEKQENKDQDPNQQKQPNNQENNNKPDENKEENSKSKLPNKTVDRMLDKLTKQEAETKRKLGEKSGKHSTSQSGKDW